MGDRLVTVSNASSIPGTVQLTTSPAVITVEAAPARLCADQNGDGFVTPADFTTWILNFNQSSLIADTNQDGMVTPADFTAWLLNLDAGC